MTTREFALRYYQQESLDEIKKAVQELNLRNLLLTLPTGCGKTEVFVRFPSHCQIDGTTLILAHRDSLIYQAKEKWERAHPYDKIGIEMAGQKLDGESYDVIVSSVQTLRGARLQRFIDTYAVQLGAIIIDECHHATEASYTNILTATGCLPVDPTTGLRTNPETDLGIVVLGVTATPKRLDRKPLAAVFPYHAYDYPLLTAMRERHLCPVRAYRLETDIDLRDLRGSQGDFVQSELEDRIDIESRRQRVVEEWVKIGGLEKRTIVFCAGKDQANHSAEEYRKHGQNVVVITEETKGEERKALFQQFSWGPLPAVLVNVSVATEGTDIPQIDCIVLESPTKSSSRFIQQVGRGLRKFDGQVVNPLTGLMDLRAKTHLTLLDVVDVVRKQSDLMTAPRLLGLPANFNLQGQDLLEARNTLDAVLNRDPGLAAAVERMADAGEELPTNFEDLRANLRRIMLFAPSDVRGQAKHLSRLSWVVAEERALLEDDAENSNAYLLRVNASDDRFRQQNEPLDTQVYRLDRTHQGRWDFSIWLYPEERTTLMREIQRVRNIAADPNIEPWLQNQHRTKAKEMQRTADMMPLRRFRRWAGSNNLQDVFAKADMLIARKHPSALRLIDMTQPWRNAPASDSQLKACKRKGIPLPANPTKGICSDLLDNYNNIVGSGTSG